MHVKENVTGKNQHRFVKDKSCLTQRIAFCDKITRFLISKREMDDIYFSFIKAFDTVFHSILVSKLG